MKLIKYSEVFDLYQPINERRWELTFDKPVNDCCDVFKFILFPPLQASVCLSKKVVLKNDNRKVWAVYLIYPPDAILHVDIQLNLTKSISWWDKLKSYLGNYEV